MCKCCEGIYPRYYNIHDMRRPKLINKQNKKRHEGKCHFCSENDYDLLDVHRITEGKDGGKYTDHNTVTACACCHRKIHSGRIVIDRWYQSTGGRVLHYTEDGEEKWQ